MSKYISNWFNCLIMNKRRSPLVACFAMVIASLSFQVAGTLVNGDFESGNLSPWQQDNGMSFNDGFSVIDNGSSQVAQIQALADDGANGFTLFQDVSALINADSQLNLSFDWLFSGVDSGEFFVVNLFNGTDYFAADGSFGSLFLTETHGSGTVNMLLDFGLFPISTMWSLEFQLNTGFDFFDDSALVQIDNVSLVSNVVSEPPFYLTYLLALGMLCYFRINKIKGNRQLVVIQKTWALSTFKKIGN